MFKQLVTQLKEALIAILPVTIAIFLLHSFNVVILSNNELILLAVGALFLIVGMVLLNIGINKALLPVGEMVGSSLSKIKKLPVLIFIVFFLGFMVTAAEPSLTILAEQIPMNSGIIVVFVALGVGLFLLLGILRIIFNKQYNLIVITSFALIFALAVVVAPEFIPTAFDSMGVATGIVTVPFIMALGAGVATTRAKGKSQESSFGLIGLAIIGPVLFMLLLGLFMPKGEYIPDEIGPTLSLGQQILDGIGKSALNNVIVLTPIILFFIIYQFIFIKLPKKKLGSMAIGTLYLFFGLLFFLTGASVGYVPIGNVVGEVLSTKNNIPLFVLVIALLGGLSTLAEPSVHVLSHQVEEVSDGTIPKKVIITSLAVGSAIAMLLSALRVVYNFSYLYIIIPGFVLAILLSLVVPNIYTSIAFDGGGSVSGALTASFLAPMILGAASSLGRNVLLDGLGTIGVLAMMPLITIQLLGFGAMIKEKAAQRISRARLREAFEEEIIYFD
jgi:hypothetical protein